MKNFNKILIETEILIQERRNNSKSKTCILEILVFCLCNKLISAIRYRQLSRVIWLLAIFETVDILTIKNQNLQLVP